MNNERQTLSDTLPMNLVALDYLCEKTEGRSSRMEAFCDLWEKASNGFVSPFLKGKGDWLKANQCLVTITDLANEWHWHRLTVRTFLEKLEDLRLVRINRLVKCCVITIPVGGDISQPDTDEQEPAFVQELRAALSDYAFGKTDMAETAKAVEQTVEAELSRLSDTDGGDCAEDIAQQKSELYDTALSLVSVASLLRVLRKSRFDSPDALTTFFREDLGGDWSGFVEAAKVLAELVLDGQSALLDSENEATREQFHALVTPFKAMLARTVGSGLTNV